MTSTSLNTKTLATAWKEKIQMFILRESSLMDLISVHLRYNYRTTLSLSKALRISPPRFVSMPSWIQWLIKHVQMIIILGSDPHDCELWLIPNNQNNFYMDMWSHRKWWAHGWASREAWDVITFLYLCGPDHMYGKLRTSPSPSWASVFWSVKWGHPCRPYLLLEACEGGNQLSSASSPWLVRKSRMWEKWAPEC